MEALLETPSEEKNDDIEAMYLGYKLKYNNAIGGDILGFQKKVTDLVSNLKEKYGKERVLGSSLYHIISGSTLNKDMPPSKYFDLPENEIANFIDSL